MKRRAERKSAVTNGYNFSSERNFFGASLFMSSRILVVVLLLVVRPLCAETYKWVDEKGVTNYSGSPPANAELAKKAQVVEERLSIYTPDPALTQAIQVRPHTSAPIPVPYAPQQYVVATQAMYDGYPYGGYLPYMPVFVVVGHAHRPHPVPRPHVRTPGMAPSFPLQSARMSRASWSR
jgi:hypothetical protein